MLESYLRATPDLELDILCPRCQDNDRTGTFVLVCYNPVKIKSKSPIKVLHARYFCNVCGLDFQDISKYERHEQLERGLPKEFLRRVRAVAEEINYKNAEELADVLWKHLYSKINLKNPSKIKFVTS